MAQLIWETIEHHQGKFDVICGAPYTGMTIAYSVAMEYDLKVIMKRKEAKAYGTKNLIEGFYKTGMERPFKAIIGLSIFDKICRGSTTVDKSPWKMLNFTAHEVLIQDIPMDG